VIGGSTPRVCVSVWTSTSRSAAVFTTATRSFRPSTPRNLLFTVGAQRDQVFDRVVDRTRSRLDVPTLRTLFGAKQRPGRNGTPDLSLQLAAVIETPRYDLTLFKVHFGNLTLKAYTKDVDAPRGTLAGG
jgi:hypothetical protein